MFLQTFKDGFLHGILPSLPFLGVGLVFLWIGKLINDLLTPYKIDRVISEGNPALGISLAGYYAGIAIGISGSFIGGSRGFWIDMRDVAIYSLAAVVLLNIARYINDYLILYRFRNVRELIEERNVGVGAVMAGGYLATGLIVRASIAGEGGSWLTALVFFLIGQAVLVLAGLWYQLITPYDVHEAIGERNNVAAGVAFGSFLFAVGYLLHRGLMGDFVGWSFELALSLLYTICSLLILAVVRLITDLIFLPKVRMGAEIGERGNVAASLVAAGIYVASVVVITAAV
ncbi:hypothetical protein DRP77_05125 [Candidatus Poribacteria bacterium]|nr:MAG: hypothetical protein DRP77_05125 [Candidatus Poribacteria bacterium]